MSVDPHPEMRTPDRPGGEPDAPPAATTARTEFRGGGLRKPSRMGHCRCRVSPLRRRDGSRRGVTLIELLVAILVAGMVGTWLFQVLVQTTRRSAATERSIDRSQRQGLLRGELFQAAHRRRTIALTETEWRVAAGEDTLVYTCRDGGFWRGERNLAAGDTLDLCRFVPSERTPPGGEAWWVYDRDLDGRIGGEELPAVTFIEVFLGYRAARGAASDGRTAIDTMVLRVPLAPPG